MFFKLLGLLELKVVWEIVIVKRNLEEIKLNVVGKLFCMVF